MKLQNNIYHHFIFTLIKRHKPTQLTTTHSDGKVTSMLSFSPQPEDDGTMLRCEGSNPRLQNSALEDSLMLNVMCK